MRPVRVLLVDDSPTVRAVVRRILERAPQTEVAGEAADGAEAVERTLELQPDAIVMDVEMPRLDGFGAIERIMAQRPTPIVVLTSHARREQVLTAFEALKRGAVAVFPKPNVPGEWETLARTLVETLAEIGRPTAPAPEPRAAQPRVAGRIVRYLAVGASTGGPAALRRLLVAFGGACPAAVLVVQHIAPGFETGLAEWLASEVGLEVAIARDGEMLVPGRVRLAPAHGHLRLLPHGVLSVDETSAPRGGHRPSVDELFLSLVSCNPRYTAAALLTGMGRDGVEGLLALRQAGALTVVQDRASCAVWGMPRAAIEARAAELALDPEGIAGLLARAFRGEAP